MTASKTGFEIDGRQGLEGVENIPLISPIHGLGAIALNMAIKYHDVTIIKDGTMYQQYKMEGRNMRELHLDEVFETAIRIEQHLLGTPERLAKLMELTFADGAEANTEGDQNPDAVSEEPTP